MKSSAVIRIIIWSAVVMILAGVLVISISGGLPPIWFMGFKGSHTYENSERYTAGSGSVHAQNVSKVEVNWISGSVNVSVYDGNEIMFSEAPGKELDAEKQMHYSLENGKLIIQFCASGEFWGWFNNMPDKVLSIRIPRNISLSNFKINATSAEVTADGVKAENIYIESISGATKIANLETGQLRVNSVSGGIITEEVQVQNLTASSVSGGINVSGSITSAEVENTSGSIVIDPGADVQNIKVGTVSGKISVQLPENDGFTANYTTVSGGFTCDFPTTSSSKNSVTYKDGSINIKLDTVSGSMAILKK